MSGEIPSGQTVRSSSSSGSDGRPDKRQNQSQQQLSQIEKSVTHLLVATKQLLETLTQWSRGTATEGQVSDVYVRLGYEFNMACRTFREIGVETNDLGPVPELLRTILEETLSQEASQASLDKFLPRIRDIIINLLHGLKRKQQRLRQKSGREGSVSGVNSRQGSIASALSGVGDAPPMYGFQDATTDRQPSAELSGSDPVNVPPRSSSTHNTSGRASPARQAHVRRTDSGREVLDRSRSTTEAPVINTEFPNPSIVVPYPEEDSMPPQADPNRSQQPPDASQMKPPQHDALTALQQGGSLERRASRRFSHYQISKQLGTSSVAMPMIPPSQNSPIPNRGRDTRESINAVRVRGSAAGNRTSTGQNESSPSRYGSPSRYRPARDPISEETMSATAETPYLPPPGEANAMDSPNIKTPEDKHSSTHLSPDSTSPIHMSSTITNFGETEPIAAIPEPIATDEGEDVAKDPTTAARQSLQRTASMSITTPVAEQQTSEQGAKPKALTLFLQYKTRVKKFVLPEGYEGLSVARLQLAFIEKFAWNTHSNGVDLPEIYLQDPTSGIRHELEDLTDVKDNSVLVLNVDNLDEMKRHLDDGLGGIRRLVEGVRTSLNDQQSAIQRVSDRQQDAAKEIARLSTIPQATPRQGDYFSNGPKAVLKGGNSKMTEVQGLRRELAVLRQTYTSHVANMEAAMSGLRAKAANVKAVAMKSSVPSVEGEGGRTYVNAGKKTLTEDSEKIINRVDDLQDVVEDLRKDVVSRGVRPLPRQLETVSRDISAATTELKRLQEYMKREKPIWTKVGENELKAVCDDQNLLTMQEELVADLEDDLEKAAQTFALVEQATKQQNLQQASGAPRSTSRTLNPVGSDVDPRKAKDNLLGEVKALQPNHETRLEAIERAEKARQLELENRRDGEFKKELGSFVEEGKLKRSGGVEEAERLRKSKDERIRKEVWDRQNGTTMATAEKPTNPADAPPKLEIPSSSTDESTSPSHSPEPIFMEAEEQPSTNGTS